MWEDNAVAIDAKTLSIVAAYNRERRVPTYVIHTPPESTIGGFSVEFLGFHDSEECITVTLQYANADKFTAPLTEVTIRLKF